LPSMLTDAFSTLCITSLIAIFFHEDSNFSPLYPAVIGIIRRPTVKNLEATQM
jgi:hypothetical protein